MLWRNVGLRIIPAQSVIKLLHCLLPIIHTSTLSQICLLCWLLCVRLTTCQEGVLSFFQSFCLARRCAFWGAKSEWEPRGVTGCSTTSWHCPGPCAIGSKIVQTKRTKWKMDFFSLYLTTVSQRQRVSYIIAIYKSVFHNTSGNQVVQKIPRCQSGQLKTTS